MLGLALGLSGMAAATGPAAAADGGCVEPERWARDTFETSFRRERRLAGLGVLLRSSGRVRGDGEAIWWYTETPIETVMRIDGSGVSRSIGGSDMEPLGKVSSGGGAEIAALAATLLGGDLGRAEADFTIERHQDPATGEWRVALQPITGILAQLVQRIELTGCERVETVLIDQPNGDQDRLIFGEVD